jgi:hypothetical protein
VSTTLRQAVRRIGDRQRRQHALLRAGAGRTLAGRRCRPTSSSEGAARW